ncbi:gp085 [Rhodococcus phage ReqiDocB7]|nr:gp085 [Rhodococcus phage ReqiDocB7]ADD80871.1 gp085 [Rhodococcus phage ReqiDocB7]
MPSWEEIDRKARAERDCPICNAKAGQPCTRATNTSRVEVSWIHLGRRPF